jgi:hypothetical protein
MILRRAAFIFLILSLTLIVSVAQGQTTQRERPLVVLIEGRAINTSSVTNVGPRGASRLQEILVDLGARIERVTLEDEIPEDADLAVLLGPLRRLRPAQIARLWVHLHRGNNLLIAVDPDNANVGTANVSHQIGNSGMTVLLERAFGVMIENTAVVPEGAIQSTLASLDTYYMPVYPDQVPHDVIAPLVEYQLPVWTWGSRHMLVEPFGTNGIATPLLYTDSGFGESNPDVFPPFRNNADFVPAPLGLDSEDDVVGWLNTAALAENVVTGSRILVLGDSEMLANGYGLRLNGNVPRYPGNYVFAQRALAWLLELPAESWPALPSGYTWIAVDGSSADWQTNLAAMVDEDGDPSAGAANIEQVRVFFDNQYLYLLVETAQPVSDEVGVQVQFDLDNDGQVDQTISIAAEGTQVISDGAEPVEARDAVVGYGDAVEVRLPQRIIPVSQSIDRICLQVGGEDSDCIMRMINIPSLQSTALTEIALSDQLIATVQSENRVNLRRTPDTEQPPLMTIANGTTFAALGRDETGEWVYVQNARYEGWLATFLLVANGDVMSLPVIETS